MLRRAYRSLAAAILAAALVASQATAALAQTAPSPGTVGQGLQQQQQRQLQQEQQQQQFKTNQENTGPTVTAPAQPQQQLPLTANIHFLLNKVTFTPSAFLTPEELQAAVQPFIGKTVDISDLNALVAAVNKLYTERKLITAQAVLPPQDIVDGELKVALVEGRVGKIEIENQDQIYNNPDFYTSRLRMTLGQPLDPNQLVSALDDFNLINDTKARATLKPGANFGMTDLQLTVIEPKRDSLDLIAANDGYQSTGEHSVGFYANHNGLLGIDDHLSAYMTGSAGSINGTLSYNLPFNDFGGRVGVSYGRGTTEVLNGPTSSLNETGQTQNGSLNVTQPVWTHDDDLLLQASGTAGVLQTSNYVDNVLLNKSITYRPAEGLILSLTEPVRSALGTITVLEARNVPNSGSGLSQRDFLIYQGSLSWIERITPDLAASVTSNWQVTASRSLPSDELFQIGGPSTVRGYQQGLISGDGGYFSQAQLTYRIGSVLSSLGVPDSIVKPTLSDTSIYAFTDSGRAMTVSPQPKTMLSVGTGLLWNFTDWVSSDISVAFPLHKLSVNQSHAAFYFRLIFHAL